LTEVREVGGAILDRGGRRRVDAVGTGRRDVRGVLALVARGDRGEDAVVDEAGRGLVQGRVVATAEGHVRHRRAVGVLGDPVHALDDPGGRAAAVVTEHLDADEVGLLGDAVALAADRPGSARAGEADRGAAPYARVLGAEPGVEDVGAGPRARAGRLVAVVERELRVVEAVQAPRRVRLRAALGQVDLDAHVLRDRGDAG